MTMFYEIDRETIGTPAGDYEIVWRVDGDQEQPYGHGFTLAKHGGHNQIDIEEGDIPYEVERVLRGHGSSRYYTGGTELRSGAALVRYLRLKGFKGVTLVDDDYRPEEPSTDRFERVCGVAWAPDDATRPDEYVRGVLAEWKAWAEGDVFGWELIGPDGSEVDSCWGYYGFELERDYTLGEAKAAAEADARRRTQEANLIGSGFIGVV